MSASPTAIARRWFQEVWNEGCAATIAEMLHPEAKGHTSQGTTTGPAEWKSRFWDPFMGAFSDIRITIEDTVEAGEKVALRWTVSMKHTGPDLRIPASGQTVTIHGMTWFVVREGLIVEGWDGWDATGMLVQCGGATLHQNLS